MRTTFTTWTTVLSLMLSSLPQVRSNHACVALGLAMSIYEQQNVSEDGTARIWDIRTKKAQVQVIKPSKHEALLRPKVNKDSNKYYDYGHIISRHAVCSPPLPDIK